MEFKNFNPVARAKDAAQELILTAMGRAVADGTLPEAAAPAFNIEIPGDLKNGDLASNAAMVGARAFRLPPRKIAEILVEHAEHVLSVPVEMVGRGNVVQVLPADAYDKDGNPDYSRLVETPVELGRNDDQYIEILSGLSEGDTVVYKMSQTSLIEQMMGGMAQSGGGAATVVVTEP